MIIECKENEHIFIRKRISMARLLVIIGVIVAIWFVFFRKKTIKRDSKTQEMVECAKCGTFISSDEAIIANGKNYCSIHCLKDK